MSVWVQVEKHEGQAAYKSSISSTELLFSKRHNTMLRINHWCSRVLEKPVWSKWIWKSFSILCIQPKCVNQLSIKVQFLEALTRVAQNPLGTEFRLIDYKPFIDYKLWSQVKHGQSCLICHYIVQDIQPYNPDNISQKVNKKQVHFGGKIFSDLEQLMRFICSPKQPCWGPTKCFNLFD